MNKLDEELSEYAKSGVYPFHMPGHKRNMEWNINPYELDITEIDGFDNLHDASGILKETMDLAADFYGAKKSYYLINGSTCGLLAAICASTKRGGRILTARNCHKAVYHAIYLRSLEADYLYPGLNKDGIMGSISPKEVEKTLSKYNSDNIDKEDRIEAVIVTSPTYDGVVSDIRAIADIVHSFGAILIVDEAHGAHFSMSEYFPKSAIECGADIVIESLHKTMPAFTQTAICHVCTDRVDLVKLERQLHIFETSSPSYIMMAGIDRCIRFVSENREELFSSYQRRLEDFLKSVKELKSIHVVSKEDFTKEEAFDFDNGKIIISVRNAPIKASQLYNRLLNDYKLQMEMQAADYLLAMTSIMDTDEGFDRLYEALMEIDKELADQTKEKIEAMPWKEDISRTEAIYLSSRDYRAELTIAKAMDKEWEEVALDRAKGRISADFINLYPPGIPMVAPGEVITEKLIDDINAVKALGISLCGVDDGGVKVVK